MAYIKTVGKMMNARKEEINETEGWEKYCTVAEKRLYAVARKFTVHIRHLMGEC